MLVTSAGFSGRYVRTSHSVSATALAGEGTGMQRDYDYSSTVHLADLEDAAGIGRSAGERAVARLNPDPAEDRAAAGGVTTRGSASSLLGHLAGAINGGSVARGTSFLKDKLGQRIFPAGIEVDRRSAPPAWPALASVRRRGRADALRARSSRTAC